MARTIATIKAQMVAAKNADTTLSAMNSPSQVAVWNLIFYIVAVAIALFEQVMDVFKTDIETQIASAPAGTDAWIQKKTFEFQYSATTPQVVQLNNYAPSYAVIDEDLQIITRCSVKTTPVKVCTIKVATSDPPAALSAPQLSALQGYWNNSGSNSANGKGIGFAGVQYSVVSYSPDLVYIAGDIKYDGQYTATIKQAVIDAINLYFANIRFDGVFFIDTLIDYIQSVPGVLPGVALSSVGIRPATVAFPTYTYLIQTNNNLLPSLPLFAGYCIGETTAANTLSDTLTFTAN